MIKNIHKRLDSTNNRARLMLDSDEINTNSWIQTEDQYLGKGLGKNSWESEAGKNITASMVVFPENLDAARQFDLSVMTSLALCDLLDLYLEDVKIKWPNDIYAGSRKIGGLLIENSIMGQKIKHSVLGIGLNVNQMTFSPEIPNPVSMKLLLAVDFNIAEISDLLIACLENRLEQLETGHNDMMRTVYLKKLYRYMVFAPYKANDKWFKARIIDVDSYGNICLETELGEMKNFGFKELEFILD